MKKNICRLLAVVLLLSATLPIVSACDAKTDSVSYEITAEFNGVNSVTFVEEVIYVNTESESLTEIRFNMFGNAYRKDAALSPIPPERVYAAYPDGKDYGYVDIEKTEADGKDAEFEICGKDLNVLSIKLDEPLEPTEKIKISIYATEKLAKIRHRLGYTDDAVTLGNFFPILAVYENGAFVECPYYAKGDPFYSEVANYRVSIKCPSEYVVASSGEPTGVLLGEAFTTYDFALDNARDFAMTLSKKYKVISGKVNAVTLNYYYYKDEDPDYSYLTAAEALKTYSKLFGDYAYPTLSVCETGFIYGGMEYPGLVYISDTLIKQQRVEVIAHEIAHEWWYAAVGNNEIENAFIDEGLAQYSTLLFYENNEKYQVTREQRIKAAQENYKTFKEVYKITGKTLSEKIARPLNEFESEFEYTYLTYVLTEIVLDETRKVATDLVFFNALKKLYREYKFKTVNKEQFIKCFSDSLKIDVSGFIESYLDGKVISK